MCEMNAQLYFHSLMSVIHRNVMSSQEVVDFVSQRIKPNADDTARPLSSIVEEVRLYTFLLCWETSDVPEIHHFPVIMTLLILYLTMN